VVKGEGYLQRLPVVARRAVEAHQLAVERKRMEEALRESEERYRRFVENAPEVIYSLSEDGTITSLNPAFERITGWSRAEWLGKPFMPLVHPDDLGLAVETFQQVLRGDVIQPYELRILSRSGEYISGEFTSVPNIEKGKVIGEFGIARDITKRKQAEDAVKRSEEYFRAVTENALDVIIILDKKGVVKYISPSIERFGGYKPQEIIGKSAFEFIQPIDLPRAIADFGKAIITKETVVPNSFRVRHKDGSERVLEGLGKNLLDNSAVEGFVMNVRDITDRKRTEETLRASREQMRALAGRLQAIREDERTNIAREIHDELGGALTSLKIDFSLLTKSALKIENDTVRSSLLASMNSMIKFIDSTIQTVREISMELRPGVLDDLGLVAALEWQIKDFEKRTGIRSEFFPPVEEISLDADLSTALFRIFQEALTNVARHSGATEVRVRLRADADSFTLEVEDNGKGIEKRKILSSKSLGLLGMRERAQMFGGHITVTGTFGKGTKVTVEILPEEKRKLDRDQEG
jgi:PAS domain S-box-containing protein